jgi:hypothetical protein
MNSKIKTADSTEKSELDAKIYQMAVDFISRFFSPTNYIRKGVQTVTRRCVVMEFISKRKEILPVLYK